MRLTSSLSILFLLFTIPMIGQEFQSSDYEIASKEKSIIRQYEGQDLIGFFRNFEYKKGKIDKVIITDLKKNKIVIFSEDIKYMYLPMAESIFNRGTRSYEPITEDTSFIRNDKTKYLYFENTRIIEGNNETWSLLQLISDMEANKIRVYTDPNAKPNESHTNILGFEVTDLTPNSYFIKKGDHPAFVVEKSKYKKAFNNIYGDCPSILQNFTKRRWNEIEEHVNHYNQKCD
ncbi:MAG TPA: hypothetical protein PKC06_17215 [Saprospiraceae bacterium]|nr:hypothetical protein [Saprospiraceae bacterium]